MAAALPHGGIKAQVWDDLPAAYDEASDGGRLPVPARQLMYAVRRISRLGDRLDSKYFLGTLIGTRFDEYLAHNPDAADWDIVRDNRGTFREPHTGQEVPLGTIAVRDYLRRVTTNDRPSTYRTLPPELPLGWWTIGPKNRFGGIVYIEKEGFDHLIADAGIAGRFDLAFASCKGYSVDAARRLIRQLHEHYGVPVYVVHDFDKQGVGIFDTLGDGYVDLGLRLDDIRTLNQRADWDLGLMSESVDYVHHRGRPYDPRPNLAERGATADEIEFLCPTSQPPFRGRRVELNALVGQTFVNWLEANLAEHGVAKVIPDNATLEAAYRRAYESRWLNLQIARLDTQAQDLAGAAELPDDLAGRVATLVADASHLAWDSVVAQLVRQAIPDDEDDDR
jgi:hypothetical protein